MSDMLYMQVEDFYSGEFSAVLLQEFTSQYDPFFIVALILFVFHQPVFLDSGIYPEVPAGI